MLSLQTLLPIILGHAPAGASTKQMVHYAQLVKSGKRLFVLICARVVLKKIKQHISIVFKF